MKLQIYNHFDLNERAASLNIFHFRSDQCQYLRNKYFTGEIYFVLAVLNAVKTQCYCYTLCIVQLVSYHIKYVINNKKKNIDKDER